MELRIDDTEIKTVVGITLAEKSAPEKAYNIMGKTWAQNDETHGAAEGGEGEGGEE